MDMSEQDGAFLQLIVIAVVFGPFYLSLLVYGIIRREKLVIGPAARWIYPASFPAALVLTWCVRFFGTERMNASSPAGRVLGFAALAVLAAGFLAASSVIIKTWQANHTVMNRDRKDRKVKP